MFMSKDKRLHSGRSINTGADPCASPAGSFPAPSVQGCHPDGSAPPLTPIPALFRQTQNMELGRPQVLSPTPVPGVAREVQDAQHSWLEGLGLRTGAPVPRGKLFMGWGVPWPCIGGGLQGDVLELPLSDPLPTARATSPQAA